MTTYETPDAPLVVAAFLARYFADVEAGTVRDRSAYEALFPGFAAVVTAEYDRLEREREAAAGPAARSDEVAGERLGSYRIERELGRGGQGIVYLAVDERFDRRVALKVLPGAYSATVARQRLLREAQAASRLDDPGICTVYDAGEEDGVAFIAMQLVEGESFADRIDRERRAGNAPSALAAGERVRELLAAFEAVLRSLHRAHEKGLVHRDVKPSNLMLAADGTPHILDFGLAAFDDHPDGSLTGEVALGTPAYMSPEQLSAREGRVDARSDVFSLAVTFYEVLTLAHPFEAPTRERLYQHILRDEPRGLRGALPGLPKDLDVVLRCALAKERARRYATALAFAEDLRSVRLREPIAARPVGWPERSLRWAQRNPVVATLAVLLLVTLTTSAAFFAVQNARLGDALRETENSRSMATSALVRERAARERAEGLHLVGMARSQLGEDPELALLLARASRQRLDHHLTRSTLRAALERWQPRAFVPGVEAASWVRLEPGGQRVAIGNGDQVVLFDRHANAEIARLPCPDASSSHLWWSDDGAHFVLAPGNDLNRYVEGEVADAPLTVTLHDGVTGGRIAELEGHRGRITAVDFEAGWVATGDSAPQIAQPRAGTVRVFELAAAASGPVFELGDSGQGVAIVRFFGPERAGGWPDLEVVSRDGEFRRVQGGRGVVLESRRVVEPGSKRLPELHLGRSGEVFVRAANELRRYEARTDDAPTVGPRATGAHMLPHAGGLLCWSGTAAVLVDANSLTRLREFVMPPREIVQLDMGRQIAAQASFTSTTRTTFYETTAVAAFADGSCRVWSLPTGEFRDVPPIGGGIVAADFAQQGAVAAVIDPAGRVRTFELFGEPMLPAVTGVTDHTFDALHPDGRRVLTFRDGDAFCVDLATGAVRWELDPSAGAQFEVATWSPDGAICAIGADDGEVRLVRAADGTVEHRIAGAGSEVLELSFSPDGGTVALSRHGVGFFDRESGELRPAPAAIGEYVAGVVLSQATTNVLYAHTTSSQIRSVAGELVSRTADSQSDDPWSLGVPAGVGGPFVLLCRQHVGLRQQVGGDGEVWLVDLRDGTRRELPNGPWGRGGIAPDGDYVVLPDPTGGLVVYDRTTGQFGEPLRGHDRPVNHVRFAADGALFATGWASRGFAKKLDGRRVCVWSRAGELVQRFDFDRASISWFDLSLDGEWVLIKSSDGELRRYPVQPLRIVEGLELREFTAAERERFGLR